MQKWKISEEQRAQILDSYHQLQAESIVNKERQWDAWRKEDNFSAAHQTL